MERGRSTKPEHEQLTEREIKVREMTHHQVAWTDLLSRHAEHSDGSSDTPAMRGLEGRGPSGRGDAHPSPSGALASWERRARCAPLTARGETGCSGFEMPVQPRMQGWPVGASRRSRAVAPRLKQSRSRGDRFHRDENAAVTGETTRRTRRDEAVDVSAVLSVLVRCDIRRRSDRAHACGRIRQELQVRAWRSRSISPADRLLSRGRGRRSRWCLPAGRV